MFTKKDITPTVMRLVRDRYGVYCNLNKNTTFAELKFDKFDVLYMVMACEEFFGIHIDETEVSTLREIKSLITLVINKLSELGMLTTEKVAPQTLEQEAKEAMEDAKSNDGVPTVKTEGDYEREDLEEEQKQKETEEQKQSMNTTESEKLPEPPESVEVEAEKVPAEQPAPIVAEETPAEEVKGE